MIKHKKLGMMGAGLLLSLSLFSTSAKAANYTILSNDSLYKIGLLFDTSATTLKTTNNLKSNTIYPGQVIDVPAKTHTVKSGDTLFLVAKQYGISLDLLRKANNKWDNIIMPGDKLLLPSDNLASSTANTSNATTTTPANSKTVISYTEKELDLLARLITAEATGQPYDAMVAVGAVVVNRVKSDVWPSTITTVINHISGGYHQFTPVKNGYINKPASSTAIQAAKEALYGSDPSNGAMFYFDDSSTNEWLWQKPVTARIGNMVYVK